VRLLSPLEQTDPFDDASSPSFLTELLFPLPAHRRTILGIVTWWESRRLVYNLIVGAAGLVTLAVVVIANATTPGHSGFGPPLLPIVAYGALANVCYTLGPMIELTLERVWKDRVLPIGPALFRQGLAFAIGLTLLPIPLIIGAQMVRIVNHFFLHW
jgi:hypothetical protein